MNISDAVGSPFVLSRRQAFLYFVALLVAVVAMWSFWKKGGDAPYIAYIGRFERPHFDQLNEAAVREFLESASVGRHKVDLRSFKLDPELESLDIYTSLRDDDKCIAVIDNTWGSDLASAKDVISAASLPVVSINADRAQNDYANRVAFIGHDDATPGYIASYLRQKHTKDVIAFVGEEYYWSTPRFRDLLATSPLNVPESQILTVPNESVSEENWQRILAGLARVAATVSEGGRLIVALNVHQEWGKKIILGIDEIAGLPQSQFKECMIIAGAYAFSSIEDREYQGRGNTELLILTNPEDALSPRVLEVLKSIRQKHGDEMLTIGNSGLYVTRCGQAVEMLRYMIPNDTAQLEDDVQFCKEARSSIVTEFQKLTRREQVGFSLSDTVLLFDKNLLVQRSPRIELHDTNGESSYKYQLSVDGSLVPNVYLGLEVTAIRQVNLNEGTFVAEFSFSIRFDPECADLIRSSADWEPGTSLVFPNSVGELNLIRVDANPDSDSAFFYRCSGTFSTFFDASDFPFDIHDLNIRIGLQVAHPVALSFDRDSFSGLGISPTGRRVPGWKSAEDVQVGVEESRVFGVRSPNSSKTVQLSARVRLSRDVIGPTLTVVFPLVGMGLCACLLICVADLTIAHVGEISIGVFIAFIGYVISFREFAPDTAGISRADWLLFVTAVVVVTHLLLIIAGNVFLREEMQDTRRSSFVRILRNSVILAYVVSVSYLLFHY